MGLSPDLLRAAYRAGVFPMAERRDDATIYWFEPPMRGILPFDGFHLSRSLQREIRAARYQITRDRAFAQVIDGCAARPQTWINGEIRRVFIEMHRLGDAHSIELWDGSDLVGGVYGLALGGVFCGESMFSRRKSASKIALATLMAHLKTCGFGLFDTQYLTPHLASLGGVEVPKAQYKVRLARALLLDADIRRFALPTPQAVLQVMTQRS